MAKQRGVFITVEGPNGVGKTTVVNGLVASLRRSGLDVVETTEPTASRLGELVRQMEDDYAGRVYACLIAADRYFHIEHDIMPALQDGRTVVSARYVESSLVLQRLDGVSIEFIWTLNSQVQIPDLSVILTASAETIEARLAERTSLSRFEKAGLVELELKYYLDAAKLLSDNGFNVLILDNESRLPEDNVRRISNAIEQLRNE